MKNSNKQRRNRKLRLKLKLRRMSNSKSQSQKEINLIKQLRKHLKRLGKKNKWKLRKSKNCLSPKNQNLLQY